MSRATTRHYDEEVAFFEAFLDPRMKYSSGWFEAWEEPLDVGIARMLEVHLDRAGVKDGSRVLEIGNGWGSLVGALQGRGLKVDYTGVNPSRVQLDYVRERYGDVGRLVEGTFEDVMHDLEGPYDAVFMLGSVCHQVDKQAVWSRIAELLAPDGRLQLEDTFFLSQALYDAHHARPETRFVQDEVFGFAHVHSLARHLDELRVAGLKARTVSDNSEHYARVIELWQERLRVMDPARFPLADTFVRYMDVFQRGWNHTIGNHVMTIERLPERARRSARSAA